MRINNNIEEYDVRSLSAITESVETIRKSCKMLEHGAELLENNLRIATSHFDSENMARAREIIKKYIKKLSEAEIEFNELLASVNEFQEKLQRAWRAW